MANDTMTKGPRSGKSRGFSESSARFEYTTRHTPEWPVPLDKFNELGKEGWELVSVNTIGISVWLFFKRALSNV